MIKLGLGNNKFLKTESELFLFCATNLQKTCCVPKPPSDQAALYDNKNYACGRRVDCGVAQKGTPCFDPHNLFNHENYYYLTIFFNKLKQHFI